MKLSFSTVMCMEKNADDVIELCRRHGLDGIEIRMDNEKILNLSSREQLCILAERLKENNISVPILGTSVCLKKFDENQVAEAKKCIDSAALLGADGIRVFLGNFTAKRNEMRDELSHDGIVKALREICEYGADKKVLVCVETHNEYATGKVLAGLHEEVGSTSLGFIWDIIHPIEDGETIEETWKYIGENIVHVHIKDGYDREDGLWHDYLYTALGKGSLPIKSVLRLLKVKHFHGFVSLEWESAWRSELQKMNLADDEILESFVRTAREKHDGGLLEEAHRSAFAPFEDSAEFCADEGTGAHSIKAEGAACSLHRWEYMTRVREGAFYDFSVKYAADGLKNPQSVYVILSVMDDAGTIIQREYADRGCCGVLEKKIKIHGGGRLVRVEMGLKCDGRVTWYEPCLTPVEADVPRKIKVATTYIDSYAEANFKKYTPAENAERIGKLIDAAAKEKPDLILFAETVNDRAAIVECESEIFETEDGAYCTVMRRKAKEHGCFVMFTFHEICDGKRYNTALLLDRNGEVAGRYRKTHLTIFEYEMGITPGDDLAVFDTEIGKIGILICYDGYFPEPARILAMKGAELILVSTAGDAAHRMVARAMENGVYVAVSCVCNTYVPELYPSKIINPRGEVVAQTIDDFSYAAAEIDLNEKKYINWLSVGPSDAEPKNVYAHERQTDFYGVFRKEMR